MHIIPAIIIAVMIVGAFKILFYIFWFAMTYPAGRCPYSKLCGNFKSWSCVCNSRNGGWHGDYDHKCFKKAKR